MLGLRGIWFFMKAFKNDDVTANYIEMGLLAIT